MNDAYIFIGSNIEREQNYPESVRRLKTLGTLVAASPVYDTPAVGGNEDTPRYYNGAVWLKTNLTPHALRNALRHIEAEMGRVRTADKNAPRTIDLDLALYGEATIDDGELTIPDPKIFERCFMARALAHLNPDYVIPPDGPTLAELACRLRDKAVPAAEVPALSNQVQEFVQKPMREREIMSEEKSARPHRADRNDWDTALSNSHEAALPEMRVALDKETAHREIADAVRTILINVGEDPDREGLVKTPDRVARAYDELLAGYETDPVALINDAFFDTEYQDMIVVKDIEFYSLCEHHMLPFFGKVHVAYIPDGKVLGLSKIPRIVEMYARRLQIQERMTQEIADFLTDLLHPRGVAVIVSGQHLCAMMRGVNQPDSKIVTQIMTGEFQDHNIREQLNERLTQSF
jgi:GTP cyclohydrolase I